MNPNYVHTITLYHKAMKDNKEHWVKSVFHNCFWKMVVNTGFNETKVNVQNTCSQNPERKLQGTDFYTSGRYRDSGRML